MIYIQILLALLLIVFFALSFTEHIVLINPIKGIMLGALYDKDYIEDEEVYQHTIQIVIIFISFTFQWDTNG